MTLTKDDLIQTLYDQSGFSKQKARTTVETVFELAKKTLESGEDVLISGFGKFSVKKKAPRKGRNPVTREDLTLDSRTVVTFRCSPVMRERVNGKGWGRGGALIPLAQALCKIRKAGVTSFPLTKSLAAWVTFGAHFFAVSRKY